MDSKQLACFPTERFPCSYSRIWLEHGNSVQLPSWVRLTSQAVRTKGLELIDWRTSSVGSIRFSKLTVKDSLAGARASA